MTRAIMIAPESIGGLGYTDFAKIEAQGKIVKQYASAPNDRELPKVDTFCSNNALGKVTLTAAEWGSSAIEHPEICEAFGKT
jgi:hypothetical protein